MMYAQGILRAVMLAVIVALSFTAPTAVQASPPDWGCEGDGQDVGAIECHCHTTNYSGICRMHQYECTWSGWEQQESITVDCEVCDDLAQFYCGGV